MRPQAPLTLYPRRAPNMILPPPSSNCILLNATYILAPRGSSLNSLLTRRAPLPRNSTPVQHEAYSPRHSPRHSLHHGLRLHRPPHQIHPHHPQCAYVPSPLLSSPPAPASTCPDPSTSPAPPSPPSPPASAPSTPSPPPASPRSSASSDSLSSSS